METGLNSLNESGKRIAGLAESPTFENTLLNFSLSCATFTHLKCVRNKGGERERRQVMSLLGARSALLCVVEGAGEKKSCNRKRHILDLLCQCRNVGLHDVMVCKCR